MDKAGRYQHRKGEGGKGQQGIDKTPFQIVESSSILKGYIHPEITEPMLHPPVRGGLHYSRTAAGPRTLWEGRVGAPKSQGGEHTILWE